jgi:uncharacterized SAM-binding protein YcdF (DUF218 family)
MRRLLQLAYALLFLFLLPISGILCSLGWMWPNNDAFDDGSAVIVVLGTTKRLLEGRVRRAVALSRPESTVVFTGAFGEAQMANDMFEAKGGVCRQALLETESTTTRENALFSRKLFGNLVPERLILVTDGFHSLRSLALFRRAFSSCSSIRFASTDMRPLYLHLIWSGRELGGILKGLVLRHFSLSDLVSFR